jgi:hypothetical protein
MSRWSVVVNESAGLLRLVEGRMHLLARNPRRLRRLSLL